MRVKDPDESNKFFPLGAKVPIPNPETFLKIWLDENGLGKKIRFFPYVMFTVRDKYGTTTWGEGTWHNDLKCYIKYPEEYKSYEHYKDLIGNEEDWKEYLVTSNLNKLSLCSIRRCIGFWLNKYSNRRVINRTE